MPRNLKYYINVFGKFLNNMCFQMGTVNLEDDFETDYPRFSGTIGVRNPRFVAAMRNAYVQQQHIQMNMMNRFKQ